MKRQEIEILNRPDGGQFKVVLFPKKKINVRENANEQKITDEVDIMRLELLDVDGNVLPIAMTPDEALEISALLTNAVAFYLQEFNKEYQKDFMSKTKRLTKNRKAREKRKEKKA